MMGQFKTSGTLVGLVWKLMMFYLIGAKGQQSVPTTGVADDCQLILAPSILVCQDEQSKAFADTSKMETKIVDENSAVMEGVFQLLTDIQNGTLILLEVKKVSPSGMTSPVCTHTICSFCKTKDDKDDELYAITRMFGFPDGCPVKARNYTVKDMKIDTSKLPVNRQNMGLYKASISLLVDNDGSCNGDTLLACFQFSFQIECS